MLTKKGKYGLKAMMHLAGRAPGEPSLVNEIAEANNIPKKFLDTILGELRNAGFAVDVSYGGNMGKRMKRANKVGAVVAIILGADEVKANAAAVRDLDSGNQAIVSRADLLAHLAPHR